MLIFFFIIFSLHHTSLSHTQSKLSQTETRVRAQYKRSLDQNQTGNAKVGKEREEVNLELSNKPSIFVFNYCKILLKSRSKPDR